MPSKSNNDEQVLLEAERLLKHGDKKKGKKPVAEPKPLSPRKTMEGAEGEEIASVVDKAGEPGTAQSIAETISQMDPKKALAPEAKAEGAGAGAAMFCMIAFLVADIGKNVAEAMAVNGMNLNSNFMLLIYGMVNLVVAPMLIFYNEGKAGFGMVFKWETFKNYAWPALGFALSMAFNLMVNQFMDAGLKKVFSQLRIPMTALACRYILGVSYSSLQWVCILSIVVSVLAFTQLRSVAFEEGGKSGGSANLPLGLVASTLGNFFAVVASLLSEKYLKAAKKTPFYIQKMQIELWQLPFSVLNWLLILPWIVAFPIGELTGNNGLFIKNAMHLPKQMVRVQSTAFPMYKNVKVDDNMNAYEAQVNQWQNTMKTTSQSRKFAETMEKIRSLESQVAAGKVTSAKMNFAAQKKYGMTSVTKKDIEALKAAGAKDFDNAIELETLDKDIESTVTQFVAYKAALKEMGAAVKNHSSWTGGSGSPMSKNGSVKTAADVKSSMTLSSKGLFDSGAKDVHGLVLKKKAIDMSTEDAPRMEEVWTTFDGKVASFKKVSDKYHAQLKTFYYTKTENQKVKLMKVENLDTSQVAAAHPGQTKFLVDGKEDKVKLSKELKAALETQPTAPGATALATVVMTCQQETLRAKDDLERQSLVCTVGGKDVTVYTFAGPEGPGAKHKAGTVCDWRCNIDEKQKNQLFNRGGWLELYLDYGMDYTNEVPKSDASNYDDYMSGSQWGVMWSWTTSPFAGWSKLIIFAIIFNCAQGWMSGIVSKVLSSLVKNILSAVATAMIVYVDRAVSKAEKSSQLSSMDLAIGVFGVVITAIVFALAPKAPKPEAPKVEAPAPAAEEESESDDSESDSDEEGNTNNVAGAKA